MTAAKTHYDTLEVSKNATVDTIRAAHVSLRQRARELSDAQSASVRLRELDMAFVVLSDPTLRAEYDRQLGGATQTVLDSPLPPPIPPSMVSVVQSAAAPQTPSGASLEARHQAEAYLKRPRDELAKEAWQAQDWAGLWRRFAASWVDGIVLYFPYFAVLGITLALIAAFKIGPDIAPVLFTSAILLTLLLYQGLFIASKKVATPGRMALGIAVVDATTGQPLGIGRAVVRSFLSLLGYLLIIPNVVALFTKKKQSIADLVAGSTVVNYRPTTNAAVVAIVGVIVFIAAIGVVSAIAIPQYQDYVNRSRIADVRADLSEYAQSLEQYFRAKGEVPESLSELSYTSRSTYARYSVYKNGSIAAEVMSGNTSLGFLVLRPQYIKATDSINWTCVSDGMRDGIRPKDCPQAEK